MLTIEELQAKLAQATARADIAQAARDTLEKRVFRTTLVESEYQEAVAWKLAWLDAEDDAKPPMLDAQIVAYLVADAEYIREAERDLRSNNKEGND